MIKVLINLIGIINIICDILLKAPFVPYGQKSELREGLYRLKASVDEVKAEKRDASPIG